MIICLADGDRLVAVLCTVIRVGFIEEVIYEQNPEEMKETDKQIFGKRVCQRQGRERAHILSLNCAWKV